MLPISRSLLGAGMAIALAVFGAPAFAEMPQMDLNGDVEAGKAIAMNRSKGNCIACHMIPGGDSPGAIGPALVAIQPVFRARKRSRARYGIRP
mgnify:CR=1 FL=1